MQLGSTWAAPTFVLSCGCFHISWVLILVGGFKMRRTLTPVQHKVDVHEGTELFYILDNGDGEVLRLQFCVCELAIFCCHWVFLWVELKGWNRQGIDCRTRHLEQFVLVPVFVLPHTI